MKYKKRLYDFVVYFSMLCVTIQLYPTIRIVDNTGAAGTYANIKAAVNAAVGTDDTILLTAGQTFTGVNNRGFTLSGSNLTFSSTDITKANPIIDLQSSGIFCSTSDGNNYSFSYLDFRNGSGSNGGVIYQEGGSLNFSYCTFQNNQANNGGAIYSTRYVTTSSSLGLSNCVFANNSVSGNGGAVYADRTAWGPSGCVFTNNAAGTGGAIYVNENFLTEVSIRNCRIVGNVATTGSALYNTNSGYTLTANNNWWGSNTDPKTISNLLAGYSITVSSWITVLLATSPSTVEPGETAYLKTIFSSQYMPNNTKVVMATTEGTLTPTLAYTLSGTAASNLTLSYSGLPFGATAVVEPSAEAFSLSLTVTPYVILGLELIKTATYSIILRDHQIDYIYTVSNTGNVTLSDIVLTDNKFTGTLCTHNTLLPGDFVICTTAYSIRQSDIDAGSITNTGMAIGRYLLDNYTTAYDELIIPLTRMPGIELIKTATYSILLPGHYIDYIYTVSNTGNVTLSDIVLTDNKFTGTLCTHSTLIPGDFVICTTAYSIKQSDIDIGNITNTGMAIGVSPVGSHVTAYDEVDIPVVRTSGLSVVKLINDNVSTTYPGVIVPVGLPMNISYVITNTGNVTLTNIDVVDDLGYTIIQPKTVLLPGESMVCTTSGASPALAELYKDGVSVAYMSPGSTILTTSTTSYASSVPVGAYRFNWACMCSDTGNRHLFLGASNSESLEHNTVECWLFDVSGTPTCRIISTLDIGSHIVINSAIYNNADGAHMAILTHMQDDDSYITLAVVQDSSHAIEIKSTTTLTSMAYNVQWFVTPDGLPCIISDEYDHISLYAVDLTSYTLTLTASAINVAAGQPSAYLYWLLQGADAYVVQGYNGTQVATYKVDFDARTISAGVVSDVSATFSTVHGCSTCYDYFVLGGIGTLQQGIVARYSIDQSGYLTNPSIVANPGSSRNVYHCERCCCGDNYLLVGTDVGLYSLDPDSFSVVASNTSMFNNEWTNVCWCCAKGLPYCIAANSTSDAYVFRQSASNLLDLLLIA